MNNPPDPVSRDMTADRLSVGYAEREIIRDLSVTLSGTGFTGLLGPNGSGKSTLLRAMARLHPVSSGRVLLGGQDIQRFGAKFMARRVGLLAQGAVAPEGLSVADLVRQGRYPHRALFGRWSGADETAVARAMAMASVTELAERPLDSLSGGQRQRVWIAMVLAQETPILMLDEPTTYLDLAHQIDLMELIRRLVDRERVTVVAVLHDLNHAARYCDHLIMLKDGRIEAQGPVAEVFVPEVIARTFDVDAAVQTDPFSGKPYCLPRGRRVAESTS